MSRERAVAQSGTELTGSLQVLPGSMRRRAHPPGMTRARISQCRVHWDQQEAAERLVSRDVLEEHQSPEGALVADGQH